MSEIPPAGPVDPSPFPVGGSQNHLELRQIWKFDRSPSTTVVLGYLANTYQETNCNDHTTSYVVGYNND